MKVVFHLSSEEFHDMFKKTYVHIEMNLRNMVTKALPEDEHDNIPRIVDIEMGRVRLLMKQLADTITVIEFDSSLNEELVGAERCNQLVFGDAAELIKMFHYNDGANYPVVADDVEETLRLHALYEKLDKTFIESEWPKLVAIAMAELAIFVFRHITSWLSIQAVRFVKK
ncbi:hypothetical protein pEaSNUABM8_00243 [Erwinia phage pEa_SNUABM_8]|nr:hypothetical protein pEaSNUABM8_00243 [Erwinia phage pEa_SNUABM_8]QVW54995.1 hypothetical protein pEaSNUABM4_00242 [Erwinia phage pEa_SNUABM_4]